MSTLRVPEGELIKEAVEEIPEGHVMFVGLDGTGDTKYFFDPNNTEDAKVAKQHFKDMIKTHSAFQIKLGGIRDGKQGRRIYTFDEIEGGAVMFVKQQAGG